MVGALALGVGRERLWQSGGLLARAMRGRPRNADALERVKGATVSLGLAAAEVRSSGSRTALALTLVAGLIGGMVGAVIANALTAGQPIPPPVAPPRVEPAQRSRLELVDAAGKPRLILSVAPSGAAGNTMLDADGKERLGMNVGEVGEPDIVLRGGRVMLFDASVACIDAGNKPRSNLDVNGLNVWTATGDAHLSAVLSAAGRPTLTLKESGTKRSTWFAPGRLALQGADGEVRANLTVEPNGLAKLHRNRPNSPP